MDVYDPRKGAYVPDGECGRAILTTLLPVGGKSGMLLLNYDTEDTTVVLSRERCECGRTHMRIYNPQREAETAWIFENAMNRVDVEAAVFQPENMEYLTGEYEAFIDDRKVPGEAVLRICAECLDPDRCDRKGITDRIIDRFLKYKPGLALEYYEGNLKIAVMFAEPGGLELFRYKGRPKRLVDRRKKV
jgi:phenylacetate-coenzyme A ligase PaaK-like adenylate-forming protein